MLLLKTLIIVKIDVGTDEDLKWHIEDDKFRKDEEAVLNQGKIIRNSPGKNIIKGVVRNIFATKYPIYQNGKIEGLMGYFIDQKLLCLHLMILKMLFLLILQLVL